MAKPKYDGRYRKQAEESDVGKLNVGVENAAYRELARKVAGKEAKAGVIANWVMNNLFAPLEEIDPSDVPSPSAVALLKFAHDDAGTFIEQIWSKLMPSRQQIDVQEKFADDGRQALSLVEAAQQEFEMSHKGKRKSGLQEDDPGTGGDQHGGEGGNLDRSVA